MCLISENLCLLATRQQGMTGFGDIMLDSKFSRQRLCYLKQEPRSKCCIPSLPLSHQTERTDVTPANIPKRQQVADPTWAFVAEMESKLGLQFETEGSAFAGNDRMGDWFGPEDVFYYAYAVFHSPYLPRTLC